eukprot:981449-Pyramimonas_sp.AAC.1
MDPDQLVWAAVGHDECLDFQTVGSVCPIVHPGRLRTTFVNVGEHLLEDPLVLAVAVVLPVGRVLAVLVGAVDS